MAVVEQTTIYPAPRSPESLVSLKPRYSQTKCVLVSYDPKPLGFF